MNTVQAMRDEGRKPNPYTLLAARFRKDPGALSYPELLVLRDYAAGNHLSVLADCAREQIKAMHEEGTA